MTAFATVQDAIDMHGEQYVITSCDRDGGGVLDTAAMEKALTDATEIMLGWLNGRVGIPDPVPGHVKRYCVDIAIHLVSNGHDTWTEHKQRQRDEAIEWCKRAKGGENKVPASTAETPGAPVPATVRPGAMVVATGPSRVFTRDRLKDM